MGTDQSIVRRVEPDRLAAALAPPASPIVARMSINIRPATLADLPFIDRLQKAQSREVGFLPTAALEGKVRLGQCLIAEAVGSRQRAEGSEENADVGLPTAYCLPPTPIGYLIGSDRYFKRDEIGYITQINVVPEFRRSLVAASLLQAQFDRSAYGCRLYACWCAQDLKANEFWEAMGFTAIAFRTGSRTRGGRRPEVVKPEVGGRESEVGGRKVSDSSLPTTHHPRLTRASRARIHIFWQKRVRAEDVATPWWYPSQTGGGEMREDRLVFPIPPGVSWRDVLPVVLPDDQSSEVRGQSSGNTEKKPARARAKKVLKSPRMKGGLWFREEAIVEKIAPVKGEAKPTIDPRLTALSRELRDRWQERAGAGLILPAPAKHDVRRMIASDQMMNPSTRSGQAAVGIPKTSQNFLPDGIVSTISVGRAGGCDFRSRAA